MGPVYVDTGPVYIDGSSERVDCFPATVFSKSATSVVEVVSCSELCDSESAAVSSPIGGASTNSFSAGPCETDILRTGGEPATDSPKCVEHLGCSIGGAAAVECTGATVNPRSVDTTSSTVIRRITPSITASFVAVALGI